MTILRSSGGKFNLSFNTIYPYNTLIHIIYRKDVPSYGEDKANQENINTINKNQTLVSTTHKIGIIYAHSIKQI